MNNLEYVRKCMRIKRTPNDAGTKLTIEFTYYDNGFVSINGSPKGDHTPDEAERWLASTRFVMQMIEWTWRSPSREVYRSRKHTATKQRR
jgi:hypothetical protein